MHLVREAAVLERHSLLIERAGVHAEALLSAISSRFERSRLPGTSACAVHILTGSLMGAPRRAVVFRSERFRDVRAYVCVRPTGAHLEVLRLVAVESHFFKRLTAQLCRGGAWWAWSLPQGLDAEEDLRTFLTVANGAVDEAARSLAMRLAGRASPLDDDKRDVLDEWPE